MVLPRARCANDQHERMRRKDEGLRGARRGAERGGTARRAMWTGVRVSGRRASTRVGVTNRHRHAEHGRCRVRERRGSDGRLIEVGRALFVIDACAARGAHVMKRPMLVNDSAQLSFRVAHEVRVHVWKYCAAHREGDGEERNQRADHAKDAHDRRIMRGPLAIVKLRPRTAHRERWMELPLAGRIRPLVGKLVPAVAVEVLSRNL